MESPIYVEPMDFDWENQILNVQGMEELILDMSAKSSEDSYKIEEKWLNKLIAEFPTDAEPPPIKNEKKENETEANDIYLGNEIKFDTSDLFMCDELKFETNDMYLCNQTETETNNTSFCDVVNTKQNHLHSPSNSMAKNLEIHTEKTLEGDSDEVIDIPSVFDENVYVSEIVTNNVGLANDTDRNKTSKNLNSKEEVDHTKTSVLNRLPTTAPLQSADEVQFQDKLNLKDCSFLINGPNCTVTHQNSQNFLNERQNTSNFVNSQKKAGNAKIPMYQRNDLKNRSLLKINNKNDSCDSLPKFVKSYYSFNNTTNSKSNIKVKRSRESFIRSDVVNSLPKMAKRSQSLSLKPKMNMAGKLIKQELNSENRSLFKIKNSRGKSLEVDKLSTLRPFAMDYGFQTQNLYDPHKVYNDVGDKRLLFTSEIKQPTHLELENPGTSELKRMRSLTDEAAGYNPLRGDFEVEYKNDSENLLGLASELSYLKNSEKENYSEEHKLTEELQQILVQTYNSTLQERENRKRIIKQHGLINQKGSDLWYNRLENTHGKATAKKLTRFSQLQTADKAEYFHASLDLMNEKRAEENKLIFYRNQRGIATKTDMKIYDCLRVTREPGLNRVDVRNLVPPTMKKKKSELEMFYLPGFKELSPKEADLCSSNGLLPQFFLKTKLQLINECKRCNGIVLKKARSLIKIDVNKTRKIFDYLMEGGLIWPPLPDDDNTPGKSKKKRKTIDN